MDDLNSLHFHLLGERALQSAQLLSRSGRNFFVLGDSTDMFSVVEPLLIRFLDLVQQLLGFASAIRFRGSSRIFVEAMRKLLEKCRNRSLDRFQTTFEGDSKNVEGSDDTTFEDDRKNVTDATWNAAERAPMSMTRTATIMRELPLFLMGQVSFQRCDQLSTRIRSTVTTRGGLAFNTVSSIRAGRIT